MPLRCPCVRPVLSDRGDNRLKLARAFGSLGSKSLFGSLGRLLRMLDGPLLAILLRPSLVYSGPLGAGGLLGVSFTFGRLLRMLRPLFAHDASFSPLKGYVLLVVSVTRGCHTWDEAGAGGRHEEEREHAHGDGGRP